MVLHVLGHAAVEPCASPRRNGRMSRRRVGHICLEWDSKNVACVFRRRAGMVRGAGGGVAPAAMGDGSIEVGGGHGSIRRAGNWTGGVVPPIAAGCIRFGHRGASDGAAFSRAIGTELELDRLAVEFGDDSTGVEFVRAFGK